MPNGKAYYSENNWATVRSRRQRVVAATESARAVRQMNLCNVNFFFMFWMFDQLRKRKKHFFERTPPLGPPPPLQLIDLDLNCWWKDVASAHSVSHLQLLKPQVCLSCLSLHLWPQKRSHLPCFHVFRRSSSFISDRLWLATYVYQHLLLSSLLPSCGTKHTLWLWLAAVSSKESSCWKPPFEKEVTDIQVKTGWKELGVNLPAFGGDFLKVLCWNIRWHWKTRDDFRCLTILEDCTSKEVDDVCGELAFIHLINLPNVKI